MNSNIFEIHPNKKEEESYHRYRKLGGIINEQDYKSALARAESATTFDKTLKAQAEGIARFAKIELHNIGGVIDPRIKLYAILREDVRPEGVERHHDEMSDQRLFAEALRMLGDVESLEKMIEIYPNISLGDYQKEKNEGTGEEEYKKAA